jgi:hypothetical protein
LGVGAAESRDRVVASYIFVEGKLQVLVPEHCEAV